MEQYAKLKEANPGASLEDLWRLVSQAELPLKRGGKKEDILPENPLDAARLKTLARRQEVGGEIPSGV